MAKFTLLIEGNICAGKSEFVRYVDAHKNAFAPFLSEEEEVVSIPEFVDHEALELFYHDMRRYTNIFERSCLTGRQVRQMKAKEGKGIYIFDRSMIGGAETFAKNSFQEGFFSHAAYERYVDDLKESLDALDRTQQESWLEQLVVYLQVSDVQVLQDRQRRRDTQGESIPGGYLERLNGLYDRWIDNIDSVYAGYGLHTPRVIRVDANIDFRQQPTYHADILQRIVTTMQEMKVHER
ncbi:deoxynucleoside kinase [Candidatus Woesearchaeota archaeon]|nr:deoxynucleoside kinase [Candidatus Woesearchaeota archaeon]